MPDTTTRPAQRPYVPPHLRIRAQQARQSGQASMPPASKPATQVAKGPAQVSSAAGRAGTLCAKSQDNPPPSLDAAATNPLESRDEQLAKEEPSTAGKTPSAANVTAQQPTLPDMSSQWDWSNIKSDSNTLNNENPDQAEANGTNPGAVQSKDAMQSDSKHAGPVASEHSSWASKKKNWAGRRHRKNFKKDKFKAKLDTVPEPGPPKASSEVAKADPSPDGAQRAAAVALTPDTVSKEASASDAVKGRAPRQLSGIERATYRAIHKKDPPEVKPNNSWDMTPEQWEKLPLRTGPKMSFREAMKAVGKIPKGPPTPVDSWEEGGWGADCVLDDPEEVVRKMVDWEGNLLPPPNEGDRLSFWDPKFQEHVEEWLDLSFKEVPKKSLHDPDASIPGNKRQWDGPSGEIVPRYWVPKEVEPNQSPQQYIDTLKREALQPYFPHESCPYSADELPSIEQDSKPFWQRYQDSVTPTLKAPDVPTARIDLMDEMVERYKRDRGSKGATARYLKKLMKEHKLRQEAVRSYHQFKAEREREQYTLEPPPNRYRPNINMYIRPAHDIDMKQITDIYNHYVSNTISVTETAHLDVSTMRNRFQTITGPAVFLPFLVAVAKNENKTDSSAKAKRRMRRGRPVLPEEKIVGFAYADELSPQRQLWGCSVDLEMFVHPDHLAKGVGKNLLDRLLWCLDAAYQAKDGCPVSNGLEGEYLHAGSCPRTVGNVVCFAPFASADELAARWLAKFFEEFGFKKCGVIDDLGLKDGQWVSQAIFKLKTNHKKGLNPPKDPKADWI